MNRYPSNKALLRDSLVVAGLVFGLALGMPAIAASVAPQAQVHSAGTSSAVSDKDVTSKVKQRLAETESLKNANIGVTTVNGVVTLSGTVSDQHVKLAAVALAVQVQGVRVLDDELKTAPEHKLGVSSKAARPGTHPVVPDSRITADVQELLADRVPAPYKVAARTDHGVVFLTGDLQHPSDIERIRQMVAKVDGVKKVNTVGLDAPFLTIAY